MPMANRRSRDVVPEDGPANGMSAAWLLAGRHTLAQRAEHLASCVDLCLDEPVAMRRLQEMVRGLRYASHRDSLFRQVLDGALSLTAADFGNVQVVDPATGALRIVAQFGFGSEFLEYFAAVDDGHSACGRAARKCAQTAIADVTTDAGFLPHREIAAATGFRAVQSTPLVDNAGRLMGMVSTHFRRPHRPSDRDLRVLELYGDFAGEAITRLLSIPESPDGHSVARLHVAEETTSMEDHRHTAGMSLARAVNLLVDGAAARHLADAVDDLDLAVGELRRDRFPPDA